MKQLYIVGFDDTEASKRAVDFAIERAKAADDTILLLYVLEWSPYSFLTNEEIAERKGRRRQELARAEGLVTPIAERVRAAGIECEALVRYGNPAELLCEEAAERGAVQIFVGRTGDSSFKARMLGSMVVNLAQASPVPLIVVP